MSNIARENIDYLRCSHSEDLAIFDDVFDSAAVGFCKRDERAFRRVLEQTGLAPEKVAFVDDLEENVGAARKMGMKGLCFDSSKDVYGQLVHWTT